MTESSQQTAAFRLISLGAPHLDVIAVDGGLKASMGPSKPLALLTFLALSPRRKASRESLCDLLWGDRNLDDARAAVRQSLWTARDRLGIEFNVSNGDDIELETSLQVDAISFDAAVESGEIDAALTLYTEEFFSGFASPGASEFERWASLQRSRLRMLFVHTAESAARRALSSGRFAEVLRLSRRLREADPHSEIGWRLALEALASSGDIVQARAEADQFEAWLRIEGLDEPEPATAAAVRTARRLTPPNAESAPHADFITELVGREREFAMLQALWDEARTRGAQRAHISGASGLGKTRLVLDLGTRLRAVRARVVYYRASPGEQHIAYSAAAGLTAALAKLQGALGIDGHSTGALLAMNPTLSSVFDGLADVSTGDEALRRRAFAMADLINAVADNAPLALIFDDLQWSDDASKHIIAHISARLEKEHVLLVTTARTRSAIPPLHEDTRALTLQPLDIGQVEQLIGSLAQLPDEEWARGLAALVADGSRGNPLMVLEVLRLWLDRDVLLRIDGRWACPNPPIARETVEYGFIIGRRLRELSETESGLLLILSLAGTPMPSLLAIGATGKTPTLAEAAMASLEARGLALALDAVWRVSHDEIADATTANASAQDLLSAHERLGRIAAVSADIGWQRRAVEHLAITGDMTAVTHAAATVLSSPPRDRASLDAELESLLGTRATPESVAAVRGTLPWTMRHPRLRRRLMFAAMLLLTAATAMIVRAMRAPDPTPEAILLIADRDSADHIDVRRINMGTSYWNASQPFDVSRFNTEERWNAFPGIDEQAIVPSGPEEWPVSHVYPDSGELEVAYADRAGNRRRLTHSRGDDIPITVAPDGRSLVIYTTRWSTVGHGNLAVVDTRTGQLRTRLTSRPDVREWRAWWSPGGERIGFLREYLNSGGAAICWVTTDGLTEHCMRLVDWTPTMTDGWVDDEHLLVEADSGTQHAVMLMNVESGVVERTQIPARADARLDPSRRWILATVDPLSTVGEWLVGPVGHFERAQRVGHADRGRPVHATWWPVAPPTGYLDRIAVVRPAGAFVIGVPYALHLAGFSKTGAPLTVRNPRWTVLTKSIAIIDSSGVFVARDTGIVIVEGTASGWRSVRDTVHVTKSTSMVLLDERWEGDAVSRWKYYGDPLPQIVGDGPGKYAFYNNGDGNFFSGAYLVKPLVPRDGMAIEAELSTPITRFQWQVVFLYLLPKAGMAKVKTWDHRTGYIPTTDESVQGCSFGYPWGEGPHGVDAAVPIGPLKEAGRGLVPSLATGRRYRVRIQLLPDGRCGYAIDGHALLLAPAVGVSVEPRQLVIEGSSAGTRILVGRVQAWSGVPSDIDWTTLRAQHGVWRPAPKVALRDP